MTNCTRTRKRLRLGLIILTVAALAATSGWFALRWLSDRFQIPLPFTDQCLAVVNGHQVTVTTEQAQMAAIIAAEATRRELPARAVSIALATAYQESGIRNLNHGDRDSLGLFQQRPSQGWGTPEQILDPWYASGQFYAALVKIPDWQNADINDIAQQIQISALPEAYRKHETNARALASALTGETPAAFSCRSTQQSTDLAQAKSFLQRVFENRLTITQDKETLTVNGTNRQVSAAVALTIANSKTNGVSSAEFQQTRWDCSGTGWTGQPPTARNLSAVLRFSR